MTGSDGASVRVRERLEHGLGAGSVARELVLRLLATHPTTDELRHDAALVVYELVVNAAMHGRPAPDGTIELDCELVGDQLRVRVRDEGSQGVVEPKPLEPEADNGRGLAIVDALASSWAVDRSHGTLITAWVPLTWRPPGG